MKKHLIIANQGLGDTIMLIPSISELTRKKPKDKFFVFCKSELEASVLRILELENLSFLYRHKDVGTIKDAIKIFKIAWKLRNEKLETVYAPITPGSLIYYLMFSIINPRYIKATNEGYFKRYKHKFLAYWEYEGHYVNYFQEFFGFKKTYTPIYKYLDQSTGLPSSSEKIKILIGPGSGYEERNKVPSHEWFSQLINDINKKIKNVEITLFGGGRYDEEKINNIIQGMIFKKEIKVLFNASIGEILRTARESDILIAGTTGPGHLTSMIDKPTIIVCNSTNYCESGPFSDNISFFHNYDSFHCSPCYKRDFNKGCGEIHCLNTISIRQITNKIKALLKNGNTPKSINWLEDKIQTK